MKKFGVWFFGIVLVGMGVLHFINPEAFVSIMPENWPAREELNLLAGVAEIILGIGFLIRKTRVISGYFICFMLICFWFLHGIHLVHPPKPDFPFWGYVVRFILQPVLIYLVWKLKDYNKQTV